MSDTMTPLRPRARRRTAPALAVGLAAMAVLLVPLVRHLDDPPRASVTVENPTPWDIAIAVRTSSDSILRLTTVGAGRTAVVHEVLVPGDRWSFVWRFRGEDIATTSVAHRDVVAETFSLRVPDEVAARLRAADTPPAP